MKHHPDSLRDLTAAIFHAAGCQTAEAKCIAAHLVEANLVGHDSHGVIRVPSYVQWLKDGRVLAGRTLRVVFENEAIAVVDGQFGFGQTIGEQAMRLGIEKAARHYGVDLSETNWHQLGIQPQQDREEATAEAVKTKRERGELKEAASRGVETKRERGVLRKAAAKAAATRRRKH